MTAPPAQPQAAFSGSLVDPATGRWQPAQAVVSNGLVTLWVASPTGWVAAFCVPINEVGVQSAAQRITLTVQGRKYPILADPGAADRARRLTAFTTTGRAFGMPAVTAWGNSRRVANQVGAAQAFTAGGGYEFLAAMRSSGAQVSRLGYGAIAAIGCGVALVVAALVLLIAAMVLT